MDTPICDFLQAYCAKDMARLHMPGHKGVGPLGVEQWDITEIEGADALYAAQGIIARSEANATALYGSAATLYSTEGSSHAIRAMVALAVRYARKKGVRPLFLAGRNAHHAFVSAVGLCGAEVEWLYPPCNDNYMTCPLTVQAVAEAIAAHEVPPVAVYITSPDYLGNMAPLAQLADLCHSKGVLLLVDNAHGAYLHYVAGGLHPLDAGADACCDSAHKTLPALTGCAYLHIGRGAPAMLAQQAKEVLALFGTTSPSYLLLASLDRLNATLATYAPVANAYAARVREAKEALASVGYTLCGTEPYKMTLATRPYGYSGEEVGAYLRRAHIECEMADSHYVVLLCAPALPPSALAATVDALVALPRRATLAADPLPLCRPAVAMSPAAALWAPRTRLPLDQCVGRVVAALPMRCPPAVPVLVPGEVADARAVAVMAQLGYTYMDCIVQ